MTRDLNIEMDIRKVASSNNRMKNYKTNAGLSSY